MNREGGVRFAGSKNPQRKVRNNFDIKVQL